MEKVINGGERMVKLTNSLIFTEAELEAIKLREKGNKKDSTGIFSNRIRPKIEELLNNWFPKKQELTRLIKKRSDS